ncbi:lysoplasmalogenase family protein [Phenylobacterium sp.]|uniref:lysoplasmalogenase family protein n=1 Tax=Phenylobacterium sp. TaxID=1871053 RepID=UPI00301DBE21
MNRIVLFAALAAGITYGLAPAAIAAGLWSPDLPDAVGVAWKGAGVSLLAVWAGLEARNRDGWMLAAVLAFGALGDVLLATHGLVVGAFAFLAGHLVAIALYARNRRPALARLDWIVAGAIVAVTTGVSFLLPPDRGLAPGVALYAFGLAAMAAAAWLSRLPRALVAAGALMFVASDLLIFLRTGRPALDILPMGLAVWGLYFGGQSLIAVGGVQGLSRRMVTSR